MIYWILLACLIVLWPELAFCLFLLFEGYILLAVLAFLTTFVSGKSLLVDRFGLKEKVFPKKKQDEDSLSD